MGPPTAAPSEVSPELPGRGRLLPVEVLQRLPWWALLLAIGGALALYGILTSPLYIETYKFLASGIILTIQLAVSAYALGMVLGLIAALGQLSHHPVPFTLSRLYIEVIRGVPLLVLLLYIAFVLTPVLADLTGLRLFRNDMVRATLGLGVGYGAYLAEIYRAGIESIPKGQTEAARSLGMTYWQSMRFIVLPQAVRVILPPLANDFIAMLKDSSLAMVISVRELTYTGTLLRARTFRSFEVYNMVALLYLTMSLIGSVGVRGIERWAGKGIKR